VSEAGGAAPEAVRAARSAATLGTSLAITTVIALAGRMLVPRMLGPEAFGELRVVEAAAEMLFVVLTLGVDIQLRREAALDPGGARRRIAGLTVLRLILAVAFLAVACGLFARAGVRPAVMGIFLTLGAAQMFSVLANTYAALEHAAGDVRWVARLNVASKLGWVLILILLLVRAPSAASVAAALLAAEAARFAWLASAGIARHGVSRRADFRSAFAAVAVSFPLFVNTLAHSFYARIDNAFLAAWCGEREVGYWGAATNVASIALLGMPLLMWVVVPAVSRAAAQSQDEMGRFVSGAVRATLLVAAPVALACGVAAPFALEILFGAEFVPASSALRILAPTFALTYISTIAAIEMIQRGKAWTVAAISLGGAAVTVALDIALIPLCARLFGDGGGARGAAWATLAAELCVAVALAAPGRNVWMNARVLRTGAGVVAGAVAAALTALALGSLAPLAVLAAALGAFTVVLAAAGAVGRDDLAFLRSVAFRGKAPKIPNRDKRDASNAPIVDAPV